MISTSTSTTTTKAIECRGLSKQYPHFSIDSLDLNVEQGSVMGFVGPNGAGKSTTMKMIMGLLSHDSGSVSVLGQPMPEAQVAAKREIGFVTEDMRLYGSKTIEFHMAFIKSVYPGWDDKLADELLRRFNLVREQKVKGLSHGQRVKACLLLALARRPKLLILDEPTTGLDPVARQEILAEMMQVLADESRTILFSSHNTLDVEQVSDDITFILDGRIIASRDKESYLDGWRRIRVELPEGFTAPDLDGLSGVEQSGRLGVVTTGAFTDGVLEKLKHAGASVMDVERMNLEEIFLASVALERSAGA
jgi:ABC-2 type transport system ATP-binding protein